MVLCGKALACQVDDLNLILSPPWGKEGANPESLHLPCTRMPQHLDMLHSFFIFPCLLLHVCVHMYVETRS